MKFSEMSWKEISGIYEDILDLPFIREIASGTLPREIFEFYLRQDVLYINSFGKVLALIASKVDERSYSLEFIKFAQETLSEEGEMQRSYLSDFNEKKEKMQPVCHHYVHYLRSVAILEPIEVGIAAILPCFWIYEKAAKHIESKSTENNPYERWIKLYSNMSTSPRIIEICDSLAEKTGDSIKTKMLEAFVTCSALEYEFWDLTYKCKVWHGLK